MANHLQAIVRYGCLLGLFLLADLLAAADFSHRTHLAKKIDCVVCHSAAVASKSAADNILPNANICTSCHPAMKAEIKAPRQLTVTKFNHAMHGKMGSAIASAVAKAIASKKYLGPPDAESRVRRPHPCTSCHTGLDQSDTVSVAAFPHMADCMTCHTDIDPPYSCVKCHTESPALRPASHTPNFVDLHSAGKVKDKSGCVTCHGRGFSCLGCH